jgi:poly(ADP-ribose) glycohydrolase ARH3
MRWTDDTQMSIDVAESYLRTGRIDPDDLAATFARSYRWSRGYGPGATKVLKWIARGADWREANRAVYASGSHGNGAAMRSPIVGLIYAGRPADLPEAAAAAAEVTHAHPLGIEGGVLIARATAMCLQGVDSGPLIERLAARNPSEAYAMRLAIAAEWLASARDVAHSDVRRELGCGISARDSCVTAIYLAMRFRDRDFAEMMQFIVKLGGDTDTVGAMAGALWGATHGMGRLPEASLARLEAREELVDLATRLHQRVSACNRADKD